MSVILKKPIRTLALEMIDIQDRSFGQQLESQVQEIVTAIRNKTFESARDILNSTHVKEIERIIFNRTGLSVQLLVTGQLAAILPFYVNKNSIFIDKFFRGQFTIEDQQKIISKAHDKKGYIDLKKAKVSGIFSEYKNKLYINFYSLVKSYELSAGEITAVILHELGHAFYVCEYSDRLHTTNQVLANVAKEMLSGNKQKDLEYIYKEFKTIDKTITKEAVDDIVNGNRVVAGYKLFKVIIKSVQGQLSSDKYDETSFEQMADNFPARFQYGRELITALDKLHDYFGNVEKSLVWNSLALFGSVFYFLGVMAVVISTFNIGLGIGVFYSLMALLIFFTSGEGGRDYTYDDLKIRYKRIRNEYITVIKDGNFTKEEMESLLGNIYFVDNIIKNTYQYRGFISRLSNTLLPMNAKDNLAIREQQLLEDLAFNDLYVKSAEFNLL